MKIKLHQVSKWYGEVIALTDITAEIGPGITGLLGPNGSGKSTLLNMMSGVLRQSRGEILLNEQSAFANPGIFKHLGICPEVDALYEELTPRQWLRAMAQLSGLSRQEADASLSRWAERLQLTAKLDDRCGNLSKGQRQKCRIIQAIQHDPNIVLFDEPLNGLDPLSRSEVTDLLLELGRAGKTVVVSSHILHEMENVADRILVIYRGRLRAIGGISDIRERIESQPHKILIHCDTPRKLAQALVGSESVDAISLERGGVIVSTANPNEFFSTAPVVAQSQNQTITRLESLDNNLESIFSYLVDP